MSFGFRSSPRVIRPFWLKSKHLCSRVFHGGRSGDGFEQVEELLKDSVENSGIDSASDWQAVLDEVGGQHQFVERKFSNRRSFVESNKIDADRVLQTLRQDGPGFNVKSALNELNITVSGLLAREVLLRILRMMNYTDKTFCAKMGLKFFMWSSLQQQHYSPTMNSYHLLMNILAKAEEFNAVWSLVKEMMAKGYPVTAQTFNILLCTCREGDFTREVERFVTSDFFTYRPFKNSYNAILQALVAMKTTRKKYELIELVYDRMLADNHSPDVLTYNIVMCAKYKLGKVDQFQRLFDEMMNKGYSPDFHTFNILLYALGKKGKPLAALDVLNRMRQIGVTPTVLHFTSLIDGLSRAGELVACKYFFDEMIKSGCEPDVVCYTVMIDGYTFSGELDKAQELFDAMISKGKLPNAFTYNFMIRGLCMAGKFDKACSMLKEMERKGCRPNFGVYNTLISSLSSAGKINEADYVINQMMEKGQYVHLLSKFKRHRSS